jgi:LDH2 family malate/lactate/ureidoglycolate dehydrogenase
MALEKEERQMIEAKGAHAFIIKTLSKIGVPERHAQMVADGLVDADLRGVGTHGIIRLPEYVKRIQQGGVTAAAQPKVMREKGPVICMDAQNCLGQVAGTMAMQAAIQKAKTLGAGIATVKQSHHLGAMAYYTMLAIKENMIGLAMTNTAAMMPPWGGITPTLGNNPFSVAFPTADIPVVLDMACTEAARGKIKLALQEGKTIPEGWALDEKGNPTTDPAEAMKGVILPAARHKGYGLAVMVDILCGVLTGSSFSTLVKPVSDFSHARGLGHFFAAIDITLFMPMDLYFERMSEFSQRAKDSQPAPGFDSIYLAGEIEHFKKEERLKNGIPVLKSTLNNLRELSTRLSLPYPW